MWRFITNVSWWSLAELKLVGCFGLVLIGGVWDKFGNKLLLCLGLGLGRLNRNNLNLRPDNIKIFLTLPNQIPSIFQIINFINLLILFCFIFLIVLVEDVFWGCLESCSVLEIVLWLFCEGSWSCCWGWGEFHCF